MEPIVPRDVIRELARAACDAGRSFHEDGVNPYPPGTAAHGQFERDYWSREIELCSGEAA